MCLTTTYVNPKIHTNQLSHSRTTNSVFKAMSIKTLNANVVTSHWEFFKAKNSEVSKVYPSQKETAIHIQTQFVLGKQFVTLIAQFQWGKTGTIVERVINMCTHPDESISC